MAITKTREPHNWQSAYNPVVFGFTSDRSPIMQDFIYDEPVIDITEDNGRPKLKTTLLDWGKFSQYIKISGNPTYNGVYKVAVETDDGSYTYLILDTAFVGNSSGGTVDIWLDNYSVIADLFIEKEPYSENFEKVFRIAQRPNPDGSFIFDLHAILNKYLSYEEFGLDIPDSIRMAEKSFLRYYIAYGDQYNVGGLFVNGGEPLTVDSIDGCVTDNLITTDWEQSGTGNDWTEDGTAIKATGTSKYIYQAIASPVAGKTYCISFSASFIGCLDSLYALRLFVTGTSIDDPTQQYNIATISITPNTGQGYTFCFTMPPGMINIAFKLDREFLSECETEELTIDELSMTIQGGDCANILFAHNSTRQYNELIGISDQLDLYTINGINSDRKFLTNYPRSYRKIVNSGEKEYLSFIAKPDAANIIKYQLFNKSGTLINTLNVDIAITEEARYDIIVNEADLTGVDYYKVSLYHDTMRVSEEFFYQVNSKCHKYQYRLHWLNLLGAADSFTFTGKAGFDLEVERLGEVKRNLWVDNFEPQHRQYDTTALNARDSVTINSGFVKREIIEWLSGVLYSKAVAIEINGVALPVQVRTDKVRKYQDSEKKLDLELVIQFAYDKIIQSAA